jgi:hypothetical protein
MSREKRQIGEPSTRGEWLQVERRSGCCNLFDAPGGTSIRTPARLTRSLAEW